MVVAHLYRIGWRTLFLPLIASFLRKYAGEASVWLPTTCGVHYGACIGPAIFLTVTKTLLLHVLCKVKIFADATIYTVTTKRQNNPLQPKITTTQLQCEELKLIPNPSKCAVLSISSSGGTHLSQVSTSGAKKSPKVTRPEWSSSSLTRA